jgi:hypothetical protein
MFCQRWLPAIAVSLSLVVGCSSSDSTLDFGSTAANLYTSVEGKFTIMAPGTMVKSQQQVQTEAGAVTLYMFLYEKSDSEAYIASYADYDSQLTELVDPNDVLDGSRDGAVGNMGGTLTSETRITANGFPGRDLVISATVEGRTVSARMRIFLVKNRLYQIMGLEEGANGVSAAIVAYLDSFKLID